MLNYLSHAALTGSAACLEHSPSPLRGVQPAAITAEDMPRLTVAKITLKRDGRNVVLKFSIANSGNGDADNVHLKMVNLAGSVAPFLPSCVMLEAGQAMTVTLIFPNVLPGTQRLHLVGGCTIASSTVPGSFISNHQVTVP